MNRFKRKLVELLNINRGVSNRNDKASVFHWVWGYITTNQIRGDYIEFGTYKGDTFIESWNQWTYFDKWIQNQLNSDEKWRKKNYLDFSEHKPQFIGVDSFQGIPDNQESDSYFSKGDFSATKELVSKRCLNEGLPKNQFKLIEGFYSELSEDIFTNKAAVIHIDSDIYQSAIDALRLSKSLIQQGTVVLFDDYNCFSASNDKGERKALKEFSEETGIRFGAQLSSDVFELKNASRKS